MQSIRRILFFMQQHHKQLKKKWGTLLLLFLFPIMLIGLVLGLVVGILQPGQDAPIRVALIDEDGTKESRLFTTLLEETASDDQFIQIIALSKEQAQQLMEQNEISTYFSFPVGFTADLYAGESVTLPIIGNPARPTDSHLVKGLIESMTRYIAVAQANILTINDYAKKTKMTNEQRQELMFQQFMDFTLYTLGKDKLLDKEVLTNLATSSPLHYYILAGWFIAFSIWLFAFYTILGKEEHPSMLVRMRLFGVTTWQRIMARILVSLAGSLILATVAFVSVDQFAQYGLYRVDYLRFGLFAILYAVLLLIGIALIDVWISSRKIVLLLQSLFTFVMIFTSGAVIPTLYFPLAVQEVLPYFFSYESLQWMIDIVLEERNYANFTTLAVSATIGLLILWGSTIGRERWMR